MAKSETTNLTVAIDLTKLGKVVFVFKPDRNFPWMAPLL